MAIFQNKFLSAAGQKERLNNAVQTLKSSVTGKSVSANTKSAVVNTVLSKAASNPFATAAVAAVAITGPTAAFSAVKAAPKTVLGGVLAAPIVTSAVVSNPKGAATIAKKTAGATRDLSNYAGNLASINSIQDIIQTGKENPILSGATIAGAGLIIGKGVSGTIATLANTAAVRQNTEVAAAAGTSLINSQVAKEPKVAALLPNTTVPALREDIASSAPVAKNAAVAAAPTQASGLTNNVRQNNYYDIDSRSVKIENYKYKRHHRKR